VIQIQRLSFVLLCLAAFGCGSSTSPSGRDSLTIAGPTPATGWHIRNNGNLQPPSASKTIADNSFSATLHLLR
jgi:hypothetical protein